MESMTRSTKSALLSIAFQQNLVALDQLQEAATLESDLQERKWGTIDEVHSIQKASLLRSVSVAALLIDP